MTEPPHLTDEQVGGYRTRRLAPAELLDLDRHISVCEACRDRLYTGSRAGDQIASLRADLDGHLGYERVVACASGSPTPADREHLELCETCRAEVDDLRNFQAELRETPRASVVTPISRGRRWMPLTIAAAIALVAVSVWSLRRTRTEPAAVALASHQLERAPILDRLITRPGTLLGPENEGQRFDLTSPQGTAVVTDRPVFRWKALAGASSYVVAIFDEDFENVSASPPVTALEWQPAEPLPRGRVLNWQVTANVRGGTVHAPTPPAPEAHFSVISADAAAQIEAARRDHPDNHLLLAALYAKAGALDDVERELGALDPAVAQPYLDSLKRMR
jgi:hypothetical protein